MAENDMLLNWGNNLIPDRKGITEKTADVMDRKLSEGMSIDSAVEILAASGYPLDVVKTVAASRRKQIEEMDDSPCETQSMKPSPPKRFADVANKIDDLVKSVPLEESFNILAGNTRGVPSLIKLPERQRKELKSVMAAVQRSNSPQITADFHTMVAPHVETAIVDSDILHRRLVSSSTSISTEGSTFTVKEPNGKEYTVDVVSMTCNCPRFIYGSFAHTGLACEHILFIKANDEEDDEYYDESYQDEGFVECPTCGGEGNSLGTLGKLHWFRCRDCGIEFHSPEHCADSTGDGDV